MKFFGCSPTTKIATCSESSGCFPGLKFFFRNAIKRKKPLVRLFAERPSQKPIVKDIYRSTSAWLKRFSLYRPVCGPGRGTNRCIICKNLNICFLQIHKSVRLYTKNFYWNRSVCGVTAPGLADLRAREHATLISCEPPLYCWKLENATS